MLSINIQTPYILFLADESRETYVKTALGIKQWRPELCAAQYRLTADTYDLGLPDLSISEAVSRGIKSLLIGTAQIGGGIPEKWMSVLVEAAEAGLDIVAGLHSRLNSQSELVTAAKRGQSNLIDIRVPPHNIPVGTGIKRSGKRLLTVGTDCALGKKYTALQLTRDFKEAGIDATFRASGQTGIMIAGEGIPIDCVVADFISGAAEMLSPDNDANHWDVIEGQGGICHPGYGAVSHGLLVGSQPDAFVVCHMAGREAVSGWPHMPLPSIGDVISRTIDIGKTVNSAIRCVGISVNTSKLGAQQRNEYLAQLSDTYQLPAVDPLIHGTDKVVSFIKNLHQ